MSNEEKKDDIVFDFTYEGFLRLLNADGINSKGILRKAFNGAKTSDLERFGRSIGEEIYNRNLLNTMEYLKKEFDIDFNENDSSNKITLKDFFESEEPLCIKVPEYIDLFRYFKNCDYKVYHDTIAGYTFFCNSPIKNGVNFRIISFKDVIFD